MLRRMMWIVLVCVPLSLAACHSAVEPGVGDENPQTVEPASSWGAVVIESSTAAPKPLSPSQGTSMTLEAPPIATAALTGTAKPRTIVTARPTMTQSPTLDAPPTATSVAEATLPAGLVVSSNCGDQETWRLSRVHWGQVSPLIPSPDGGWLAQTVNPDGDARLAVTHAGRPDQVVVDAPHKALPLGMPFWSPSADAGDQMPWIAIANVALSQPGGGSIYVVRADGSGLTHVADYLGYHDDVAWSPDGAWIAYASAATVSGAGSGMQVRDYQVLVVPSDGSAEPVVVGPGCNPHWQVPAPEIVAFQIVPTQAKPGDTVSLAWQARGETATLCPSARYILFTADDCWQVPVSGFTTFLIPVEAEGFQYVDFILKVETSAPLGSVTSQASVALECERTWFFSDALQAGICPLEPVRSAAAAQHFQNGLMIWLREPGRYYVLEDTPLSEAETSRNKVDIIVDPLRITRDTSADAKAPPGFYVPESGFGLVWRGDVDQSPGYRDRLGWALAPEFNYEAVLQCDDARPSGGRSWQICYLQGPDAEVIVLHPLGGWALLRER